jgi:hypothetical protein
MHEAGCAIRGYTMRVTSCDMGEQVRESFALVEAVWDLSVIHHKMARVAVEVQKWTCAGIGRSIVVRIWERDLLNGHLALNSRMCGMRAWRYTSSAVRKDWSQPPH